MCNDSADYQSGAGGDDALETHHICRENAGQTEPCTHAVLLVYDTASRRGRDAVASVAVRCRADAAPAAAASSPADVTSLRSSDALVRPRDAREHLVTDESAGGHQLARATANPPFPPSPTPPRPDGLSPRIEATGSRAAKTAAPIMIFRAYADTIVRVTTKPAEA